MSSTEESSALPNDPAVIALLEAAGVWMWEADLPQETTIFQPGFWEQYGYQAADMAETFEFIRVMERDDLSEVVRAWRAHLEDGAPFYQSEWRLRLPDGGHRWISARGKVFERDAAGKPVRVVGVYRDVTDAREAERVNVEAVTELDAVFRSAPHGLALIAQNLTVLRVNDRAKELLALFSAGAFNEGSNILDLPSVSEDRPVVEDIRRALLGATPPDRTLFLPTTQQWVELTYAPVEALDGASARAIVSLRDVSDRVRTEQTRAQVMRLESMGLMAGGIAHDFNNLLAAIVGNIDVARDGVTDSGANEGLAEARSAAMRASELTQQLLAFAGQNEPQVRELDVSEIVAEIVRYARRIPGTATAISEDLAGGLPMVRGDANQLRQVVLNLVVNALDATRERGSGVAVRTFAVDDADQVTAERVVKERPAHRYVALAVEDDGSGMDEATRQRIFDPFFSTKPEGHGLGLASVLGAVRAHGGGIALRTAPGEGAAFTVLLPTE